MTAPSPFCRAGLPTKATRPRCPEPVISADEADTLNVSRRWCSEHARILSDAKHYISRRVTPKTAVRHRPAAPVKVSHAEPTAKKTTGRSRIDRQQLAQQIADYIAQADTYPVTGRQLSAHLGVSRAVIAEGAAIALANGTIRSVVGAGPKLSGYYAPEADERAA